MTKLVLVNPACRHLKLPSCCLYVQVAAVKQKHPFPPGEGEMVTLVITGAAASFPITTAPSDCENQSHCTCEIVAQRLGTLDQIS